MGVPFGFMIPKVFLTKQLWEELYPHCSCKFILPCCCSVTQSCPILCDPVDCSPPGSSVPGISQAITLEWVAISFCRESSQSRDQITVSCSGTQILYHWATSILLGRPSILSKHWLADRDCMIFSVLVSSPYLKGHLKSGNTLISKCCSATVVLRGKPITC